MENFKLPEIWCCLATNKEEDIILTDYINEHFNTQADYDPAPLANCWFSNVLISDYHYKFSDNRPENCTEITFQQFKDYVLREKPVIDSNLEEVYKKLLG